MSSRKEEEIYQEHVLDHFEDPYHRGELEHRTHVHQGDNPLCGDQICVQLKIGPDQRVQEAWFTGDGCCISLASASMLMQALEGKTVDEVRAFTAEEMLELYQARLTPNRQKCCLLSWRVSQAALFSPVQDGVDSGNREPAGGEQSGPHLGEES